MDRQGLRERGSPVFALSRWTISRTLDRPCRFYRMLKYAMHPDGATTAIAG